MLPVMRRFFSLVAPRRISIHYWRIQRVEILQEFDDKLKRFNRDVRGHAWKEKCHEYLNGAECADALNPCGLYSQKSDVLICIHSSDSTASQTPVAAILVSKDRQIIWSELRQLCISNIINLICPWVLHYHMSIAHSHHFSLRGNPAKGRRYELELKRMISAYNLIQKSYLSKIPN